MCIALAAIGGIISAIGSVAAGMAQASVAKYNEKVSEINASAAYREGLANAGATRDQFGDVAGEQRAALAKAGVDIDSGTAAILGYETKRREETAAAVDIWKGATEQTKYLNQAGAYKAEGKAAMMSGIIGGLTSLVGEMSGFGSQGAGKPVSLGAAAPQVTGTSTPYRYSGPKTRKRIILSPALGTARF